LDVEISVVRQDKIKLWKIVVSKYFCSWLIFTWQFPIIKKSFGQSPNI
jgi:hypothetical protein